MPCWSPSRQLNWPSGKAAATLWELSLRHHLGKLTGLLQADGFQPLPIALAHGVRAGAYSQPHRDPFDRMLAADHQLSMFPCRTLWAGA